MLNLMAKDQSKFKVTDMVIRLSNMLNELKISKGTMVNLAKTKREVGTERLKIRGAKMLSKATTTLSQPRISWTTNFGDTCDSRATISRSK